MTTFLGALIGLAIATAIHEGGHTLAGAWAGASASRVRLGFGPCMKRFTAFGTAWEIHVVPISGSTGFTENALKRVGAARRCFIGLAGPLANLVVAGVLWNWPLSGVLHQWLLAPSLLFGLWGLAPAPGLDGLSAWASLVAWGKRLSWKQETHLRQLHGAASWGLWALCVPWFLATYGLISVRPTL